MDHWSNRGRRWRGCVLRKARRKGAAEGQKETMEMGSQGCVELQ